KNGKLDILYKKEPPPTVFDPRDGARIFAYHRETQRYKFFTPSFETLSAFEVDPSFAIQPWLICTSGENKLWILDAADNTLKKVNARSSEVEVEVVVDSTSIGKVTQFTTMREYQAFVFLLNPEGL